MSEQTTAASLDLLMPAKLGLRAGKWFGGVVFDHLKVRAEHAKTVGQDLLLMLDQRSFIAHRLANYQTDEKHSIEDEMIDRKSEYEIVDLNARRWTRTVEGPDKKPSVAHLTELRGIMERGKIAPLTIDIALAKLVSADPNPTVVLDLTTSPPGWSLESRRVPEIPAPRTELNLVPTEPAS